MPTIYLVVQRGGEYDSKWKRTLCARYTQESAERTAASVIETDKHLRQVYARTNAHMAAYVPPTPPIPYPDMLPKKKWPQGMRQADITQAMRDERDAIVAENDKRLIPYRNNQAQIYGETNDEFIRYLTEVERITPAEMDNNNITFYSWRPKDDDVETTVEPIELE